MNTASFLAALRANPTLPLVFRAGAETVHAGYHLTEVKRVAYETMDCGAMMHRWSESQFELWVPPLAAWVPGRGHMPAEKFLRIVDRVEAQLPLQAGALVRIHASFAGQPAALYGIESVTAHEGQLWIELTGDRTRCKAAERKLASVTGGCCGSADPEAEAPADAATCGCGSKADAREATCCS